MDIKDIEKFGSKLKARNHELKRLKPFLIKSSKDKMSESQDKMNLTGNIKA